MVRAAEGEAFALSEIKRPRRKREPDDAELVRDFDGSDSDAAEERAEDAEIARERRRNFLTRVLSDPEGRAWVRELLRDWYAFQTPQPAGLDHSPAGLNARAYFYGVHDCGWRLWTEFDNAAPELASAMRRGAS